MQGITVCGAFKLVIEELIKAEEELQVLPWLMTAALERAWTQPGSESFSYQRARTRGCSIAGELKHFGNPKMCLSTWIFCPFLDRCLLPPGQGRARGTVPSMLRSAHCCV